ncbi:MAG: hypothetical protein QXS90_01280 [Candidatus Diapherotrites archaeon]
MGNINIFDDFSNVSTIVIVSIFATFKMIYFDDVMHGIFTAIGGVITTWILNKIKNKIKDAKKQKSNQNL